jgi:(p)ppGpp synthase/HD superfamily hydrolase
MVQINTFKGKNSANKHRLEYLQTSSAKSQLNKYLRQLQKSEIIEKGIQLLNKKLKEYDLPKYDTD